MKIKFSSLFVSSIIIIGFSGCAQSEYKLAHEITTVGVGRVADAIGDTFTYIKDSTVEGYEYIENAFEENPNVDATEEKDTKE